MKFTLTESADFQNHLLQLGYKKYTQNYKNSDLIYWKSFDKTKDEFGQEIAGYQLGVAFYDFSKFPNFTEPKIINTSYHFLLGSSEKEIDHLSLQVNDEHFSIEKFETFSDSFYNCWYKNEIKNYSEY